MFTIKRKDGVGETLTVDGNALLDACERLSEGSRHQLDITRHADTTIADAVAELATEPATPGVVTGTYRPVSQDEADAIVREALETEKTIAQSTPKANSSFGGPLVTDETARARIEAQHAALKANGVKVDTEQQFYATGTRMADDGYATQNERKREHDAKQPIQDTAHALIRRVRAEGRHDETFTARELAESRHVNGAITVAGGHVLSEQAIRGLAARLGSPMLGFVLGVRDRMSDRKKAMGDASRSENDADRRLIHMTLWRELMANPAEVVKLRMRSVGVNGRPDVYATVSTGYSPADAPEAIGQIVDSLPTDCKGSFSYDVASTSWELRASVWTPTPVAEQAVGEAFEGYASFTSKDNGTMRFRGGGGVTLLRCLNASTYTADGTETSRIHRGNVLYDIDAVLRGSLASIDALCNAWGVNRAQEVPMPEKVTIEDAIPGFWAYCLKDRRSELMGVLPGKTKEHVAGLTQAFFAERRDTSKLVRSDFAQGWTRYVQDQPTDVRRDAEAAIGGWLVGGKPIRCELKEVATV